MLLAFTSLYIFYVSYSMKYSFGLSGCPFPRSSHPQSIDGGQNVGKTVLVLCQCCTTKAKHWCVINTSVANSARYSSVRAAVRKNNFISARPNASQSCNEIRQGSEWLVTNRGL